MRRALTFIIACALTFTVGWASAHPTVPIHRRIVVRWCPEDAVHLGRGAYDGTRWTWYECIARDDLTRYAR